MLVIVLFVVVCKIIVCWVVFWVKDCVIFVNCCLMLLFLFDLVKGVLLIWFCSCCVCFCNFSSCLFSFWSCVSFWRVELCCCNICSLFMIFFFVMIISWWYSVIVLFVCCCCSVICCFICVICWCISVRCECKCLFFKWKRSFWFLRFDCRFVCCNWSCVVMVVFVLFKDVLVCLFEILIRGWFVCIWLFFWISMWVIILVVVGVNVINLLFGIKVLVICLLWV